MSPRRQDREAIVQTLDEGADAAARDEPMLVRRRSTYGSARIEHSACTSAHCAAEVGADPRCRSQWAHRVLVKGRHVLGSSAERSADDRTVTDGRAVTDKRRSGAEAVQPHRAGVSSARGDPAPQSRRRRHDSTPSDSPVTNRAVTLTKPSESLRHHCAGSPSTSPSPAIAAPRQSQRSLPRRHTSSRRLRRQTPASRRSPSPRQRSVPAPHRLSEPPSSLARANGHRRRRPSPRRLRHRHRRVFVDAAGHPFYSRRLTRRHRPTDLPEARPSVRRYRRSDVPGLRDCRPTRTALRGAGQKSSAGAVTGPRRSMPDESTLTSEAATITFR